MHDPCIPVYTVYIYTQQKWTVFVTVGSCSFIQSYAVLPFENVMFPAVPFQTASNSDGTFEVLQSLLPTAPRQNLSGLLQVRYDIHGCCQGFYHLLNTEYTTSQLDTIVANAV